MRPIHTRKLVLWVSIFKIIELALTIVCLVTRTRTLLLAKLRIS
jgi:hypothetical protein